MLPNNYTSTPKFGAGKLQGAALGFFQKTAQEGQVALIVPEAAVITGRSTASAKRGGFLEFQERFIEETVVAFAWLWGVKAFKNLLDKMVKSSTGVDTAISWRNVLKKANNSVDLHPDELRGAGAKNIQRLLKYKTAVTASSLGITMAIVAVLIPWLNQKKTEWILKNTKYGQPQPPAQPTGGAQAPALQGAAPQASAGHFAGNTSGNANLFPPSQSVQAANAAPLNPKAPPGNHPRFDGESAPAFGKPFASPFSSQSTTRTAANAPMQQPQFGGIGQAIGYAINHTPYGEILSVDTGITGGRAVVAAGRSPFESAEIIFRDGLSLYFYILSAPHLMKMMGWALNDRMGTSLRLDPDAAKALNVGLNTALKEAGLPKGQLSFETLQKLVNGTDALQKFAPEVDSLMRSTNIAEGSTFAKRLVQEAHLFEGVEGAAKKKVLQYLGNMHDGAKTASTDEIGRLIRAINEGVGLFNNMDKATKANLTLAVKQAFRHTAGINIPNLTTLDASEAQLQKLPKEFKDLINAMPEAERAQFVERAKQMATRDGLDLSTSMFRRLQVLYGQFEGHDTKTAKQADDLINWMEKAVRRNTTLAELVKEEAVDLTEQLGKISKIKNDPALQAALSDLGNGNLSGLEDLEKALSNSGGQTRRTKNWLLAEETLERRVQGLRHISMHADDLANPDLAQHSVEKMLQKLSAAFDELPGWDKQAKAKELVRQYTADIQEFISGRQGRIFSLFTEQGREQNEAKLAELLEGGLKHDSQLQARALHAKGELVDTMKRYASAGKQKELNELMEHYLDTALAQFEKSSKVGGSWQNLFNKLDVEQFFQTFQQKSQRFHLGARAVAMGGTLLGLGVLVPVLQNKLTKKLTGKNEHPGIASVSGGHGEQKPAEPQQSSQPSLQGGAASSLSHHNFPTFKRIEA